MKHCKNCRNFKKLPDALYFGTEMAGSRWDIIKYFCSLHTDKDIVYYVRITEDACRFYKRKWWKFWVTK